MERHDVAAELARELYGQDDVEVLPGDWLVESAEPKIEAVDGGYWVQARVFVDADKVEARMEPSEEMTDLTFEVTIQVPVDDDGEGVPSAEEIDYAIVNGGVAPNEYVTVERK